MALKDETWRHDLGCYPVRLRLQTRYGDMDTNAHLNNVAIARLFEESRLRFHSDLHRDGLAIDPGGLMIAHIGIDYVAEGRYPADIEAGVGVAGVGTRSFRLALGLFQEARAIALAECVMVLRHPPSDALRHALEERKTR